MARIGSDYRDDGKGHLTVTHFVDELRDTHDADKPCPVCVTESALQEAESAFGQALRAWIAERRESARKVRGT